ncbi:MAG TPA: hypothetical protein VNS81_03260 [Nocardioides sp.]|nr:hypothetical protein [Nocardioides sp.]
MASTDEFGPDTERIRAWLDKRATYAKERASDPVRIAATDLDEEETSAPVPRTASPPGPEPRWEDVTPDIPAQPAPGGTHRSHDDRADAARAVVEAVRPGSTTSAPAAPAAPSAESDAARAVVDAVRGETPAAPHHKAARPPKLPKVSIAKAPKAMSKAAQAQPSVVIAGTATRTVAEIPAAKALPRAVAPEVRVGRWTEPIDNQTAEEATTDVDFPVRKGGGMLLSILLLVTLAATGVAAYLAWDQPTTATVGVAGTFGALTLVVWAVRASMTATHLSIHRGQLTVRRGGRSEVVDISSGFTPIAIVGRPGQRSWKVLIERVEQPLLTITPAMVDPHWFTSALYRLRADLRPDAQDAPAEQTHDASVGHPA